MNITLKALRAPVGAVAAALVLAGCSPTSLIENAVEGAIEKGFEKATDSEIELSDEGIAIKTEDGELSIGAAEVPEGFPANAVPLIDGQVVQGVRVSDADGDGYMVSIAVHGTINEVFEAAAAKLEGAGLTESSSTDLGQMRTAMYEGTGEVRSVGMNAIFDEHEGVVTVSYVVTIPTGE